MILIRLQIGLVGIASSYLTLGAFSERNAEEYWWVYAIVTFVLAVWILTLEWRRHA